MFGELRVQDPAVGQELLKNLTLTPMCFFTTSLMGEEYLVEAFDSPLVVQQCEMRDVSKLSLKFLYGLEFLADLKTFKLDEWDRLHGRIQGKGLPFVFSRKAQASLFSQLEEYGDDYIMIGNERVETPPYFDDRIEVESSGYWNDVYEAEGNPGWNLGAPAVALVDMLPRLKLPKSRVLVLGCGEGHDAAHFAREGHIVTAIDFSKQAIERAKKNYGHLENLRFVESDIFELGSDYFGQFDLLFEHTCYCAINPTLRNELVSLWRKMLAPKGQLLGVFFAMEKLSGPPYGGTEWELRERLRKYFRFLFWGRLKNSIPGRRGREMLVLAEKFG